MKLSFDDGESLKEAVESLCFNDPPSDPNTCQRIGSMLHQDSERNEDLGFKILQVIRILHFGVWKVVVALLFKLNVE